MQLTETETETSKGEAETVQRSREPYEQALALATEFNQKLSQVPGVTVAGLVIHWDDDRQEGPQVVASHNDLNSLFRLSTALNDAQAAVLANVLVIHSELQKRMEAEEMPPAVQDLLDAVMVTKKTPPLKLHE